MSSRKNEDFSINEVINLDCRFFLGDRPCKPHKQHGVHCEKCDHYEPVQKRILIIKLGAVGDVIRTTPLLHVFRQPGVHITWLTETPAVVPKDKVDRILKLDAANLAFLQAAKFDVIYNLDKDAQAIALTELLDAPQKIGFRMDQNVCIPVGDAARKKWLTGLFDDLNIANTQTYLEEIFEICGLQFNGEKYIVSPDDSPPFKLELPRPLVGLNTGCGVRWPSRLWAIERWIELSQSLLAKGYGVLLLGGPDEEERNKQISAASGAVYLGTFPLQRFFHLIDEVDLLVTGVTMAMHIGIGLEKRIVLMNNIFNRHEFELYGLGQIVEPDVDCLGCFKPVCDTDCMNLLKPADLRHAVEEEIVRLNPTSESVA